MNLKSRIIKYFSNINPDYYYILALASIILLFLSKTFIERDLVGDPTTFNLPHYQFIIQNLRQGIVPFWNPYDFWGLPELFSSGMANFNPFVIFYFAVNLIFNRQNNVELAGNLIELTWGATLIFGAIGIYFLLRRKFASMPLPALFAALVFVLCPTILDIGPIIIIGVAILPWLIWALLNFLDQSNFKTFIWLVLANFYVFADGYPYFFVFFLALQVLLVLIYKYRKIIWFGLAYLISVALATFFLWPNFYIYTQSFRNAVGTTDALYHKAYALATSKIVTVLFPRLFESGIHGNDIHWLYTWIPLSWGVIPLIFLAIGFFILRKERLHIWLVTIFLISILYAFAGYMDSIGFLGTVLPVIVKFRSHTQALPIAIFSGVIIINIGMNAALAGVKTRAITTGFWVLTLALFLIIAVIPLIDISIIEKSPNIITSIARTTFLLAIGLILLYLTIKNKSKAYFSLMIFIVLAEFFFYFRVPDSIWADYSYDKFYQKNSLIPEIPSDNNLFRIMFEKNQFTYSSSLLGIENYAGYNIIQYQSWYDSQPHNFETIKNSNVKYVVTTDGEWQKDNPNVALLYKTGPKIHPEETFVSEVPLLSVWLARSNYEHYVYLIKNYLPRYYVPKEVKTCNSDDCKFEQNPPQLVNVDRDIETFYNPLEEQVKIKIISRQANEIRLKVNSSEKAFIVASETWDKDWQLKVNGKSEILYEVNNGIRGFFVPAGDSEVVMSYFPADLIPGLVVTLIGIILLLLIKKYRVIEKRIKLK